LSGFEILLIILRANSHRLCESKDNWRLRIWKRRAKKVMEQKVWRIKSLKIWKNVQRLLIGNGQI
jgi:hypothetical protein